MKPRIQLEGGENYGWIHWVLGSPGYQWISLAGSISSEAVDSKQLSLDGYIWDNIIVIVLLCCRGDGWDKSINMKFLCDERPLSYLGQLRVAK